MGKAKELAELANNLTVSGGAVTVSGFNYDNIVDSAPGALNTLNELAAAIGDDASFSTTVTNSIATKLPLAGGTLTGNIAHASAFTIDTGGDITLDSDSGVIDFDDGTLNFGRIENASSDFKIESRVQDKDIVFVGNDGGSGIEAMRIDMSAGGNVGIGTATPAQNLTVYNATASNFEVRSSNKFVGLNASSGYRPELWWQQGQDLGFGTATNGAGSGYDNKMLISSAGNVGIGGTVITDVNLLNLQGDGSTKNVGIVLNKTNSTAQIWSMQVNNTTGGLYFHNYTASNTPVAITTSGNVMLGTTVAGRAAEGADRFTIADSTHSGMTIRSGTSSYGSINFSDSEGGAGEYAGSIFFGHGGLGDKLVLATGGTDRVTVNSTGVGIGTQTPGYTLQVDHGTTAQYATSIRNTADNLQLLLGTTTGALLNIQGKTISSNAAYQIALQAEGGYVGIGTASPDKTLTVRGTSGDVVQAKIIYAGTDGNRSGLILQNTHTGGREYGLYVGNSSTGGGLGTGFGISDNTAGTAYRLFINSSGNVSIGTTDADKAQLSVYASADKPALLLSNADGGINPFAHRNSRYLTSNGTNWLVDGKDPIAVIATSSTSQSKFPSNGLVMHNETTTSNAFSPPIMFGSQSNSQSFNSAYGYIAGRKIGTGVDTNWNTGEVWIDTAGTKHNGNNAYMDNVPAIRVRTTGTVDMPWQAFSQGTFAGVVASNNTGFQMTVASSQGLNYNNHSTHGYGFTATEEGYYMCYATCLYYPGANGYVYFGWCLNGASKHHWHSNHAISSNHDFVSATLQYCNVGDHLSIENVSASLGGIWGGAHSQYYIWKVG